MTDPLHVPEPGTGPRAGRYAPSPSGDLHLGNLRTALLAWLFARSEGRPFRMRLEDLDRVQPGAAQRQLEDLAALGLDWDGQPLHQSGRREAYAEAVEGLRARGLVYECFCTRREIQEAASAPHDGAGSVPDRASDTATAGVALPPGAYPGTCRDLSEEQRARRRAERPAALRLDAAAASRALAQDDGAPAGEGDGQGEDGAADPGRGQEAPVDAAAGSRTFPVAEAADRWAGTVRGAVDDMVLVRSDGVPAYHLAVILDDAAQGVGQVVRGDDLLSSAPRQAFLARLLGLPVPGYVHVPLALNKDGRRLAKRDGAVTLRQLGVHGVDAAAVGRMLAASMPLPPLRTPDGPMLPATAEQMLEVFDPDALSRRPWTVLDPLMESACAC